MCVCMCMEGGEEGNTMTYDSNSHTFPSMLKIGKVGSQYETGRALHCIMLYNDTVVPTVLDFDSGITINGEQLWRRGHEVGSAITYYCIKCC